MDGIFLSMWKIFHLHGKNILQGFCVTHKNSTHAHKLTNHAHTLTNATTMLQLLYDVHTCDLNMCMHFHRPLWDTFAINFQL
jgi:hypothetical protein